MKFINNEQEYNELLKNNNKVIIDFFADWCGPCKMLAPIYENASKKADKNTIFAKINVDKFEESKKINKIASIPTMIVFNNGKETKRHTGILQEDKILELLK